MSFEEDTAITTTLLDQVQSKNDLMNIIFDGITQQMALDFENYSLVEINPQFFKIISLKERSLKFQLQYKIVFDIQEQERVF